MLALTLMSLFALACMFTPDCSVTAWLKLMLFVACSRIVSPPVKPAVSVPTDSVVFAPPSANRMSGSAVPASWASSVPPDATIVMSVGSSSSVPPFPFAAPTLTRAW